MGRKVGVWAGYTTCGSILCTHRHQDQDSDTGVFDCWHYNFKGCPHQWPDTDHSVNGQQFLCLTNDLEYSWNRAWVATGMICTKMCTRAAYTRIVAHECGPVFYLVV